MDLDNFIITVFCCMDDALKELLAQLNITRVRQRGPAPSLSDSEVLSIEVVGQHLGLSQDKAIFSYFRTHYSHFFPSLLHVHRTTFTRQSANLWAIKERVWHWFIQRIQHNEELAFVDSFPLPVCRFARVPDCKRMREISAYGRDSATRQTFYGLRLHARVCFPGVITRVELAPANVHELYLVPELAHGTSGILIGDRNYWAPLLKAQLEQQEGLALLAPYRKASGDPNPKQSGVLSRVRQRIESVFGQLCERYTIKRMWARDIWHLSSRIVRMLLTHTLCVLINQLQGNTSHPLRFANILSS